MSETRKVIERYYSIFTNKREISTETVRNHATEYNGLGMDEDDFNAWLAEHDAEVRRVERERIIRDMQDRSHPDDWGVPCVYVKSYAERLRGIDTTPDPSYTEGNNETTEV